MSKTKEGRKKRAEQRQQGNEVVEARARREVLRGLLSSPCVACSLYCSFQEMPTNRFVESSFWNFDALFQPQSHPSRDMHDTFFIKDPAVTPKLPEGYVAAVKEVHEVGGHGSIGYRNEWKMEEATKNLLRTHTTAVSARMLYQLANVSLANGTRRLCFGSGFLSLCCALSSSSSLPPAFFPFLFCPATRRLQARALLFDRPCVP